MAVEIPEENKRAPSLEHFAVLTWLRFVNIDLPAVVRQKYGTKLWSQTIETTLIGLINNISPIIIWARILTLDELKMTYSFQHYDLTILYMLG